MIDNNQKIPSKRLFVGSLPYKFTEGELLSLFITEGKIVSVKIIHNQWGRSRGMGYVEFENEADAIKAKMKFHNQYLGERTIIVDYAEPDPFLTPEGQAKHQEAMEGRKNKGPRQSFEYNTERSVERYKKSSAEGGQVKQPNTPRSKKNKNRKFDPAKPELKFKSKKHVRDTIFESRNFGSRVGSKFSSRNKKKK